VAWPFPPAAWSSSAAAVIVAVVIVVAAVAAVVVIAVAVSLPFVAAADPSSCRHHNRPSCLRAFAQQAVAATV